MKTKYTLLFVVMILMFAGIQSCKTKKQILSATPIELKVEEKLFTDIVDNQFNFNSFSSKLNLNLSSGTKSLSSKSSLKILKNKAIQISVQPLFGVEMLRLYIDPDSVVVLDRMNKRYVKESLNDIKKDYPVGFDFRTLQSLLTNRIFVSGKSDVNYADYQNFTTNKLSNLYYQIKSIDKESGIEYSFGIDGNDRIAFTQLSEPKEKYYLEWKYEDFIKNNHNAFPHKMNVVLTTTKRKADLGLEFSGIVLNDDFDLQISIPNSYTKAEFSDIVKLLTKI